MTASAPILPDRDRLRELFDLRSAMQSSGSDYDDDPDPGPVRTASPPFPVPEM